MKKFIKSTAVMGAMVIGTSSFAQVQDEKNVTMTMDLQPILQLKMEGPDQFDFTFDEINEYYAGITKYGATTLKVSATVDWDLWAVGLSQANVGVSNEWDQQVAYQAAPGGINTIPLSALELHQTPQNPAITGALCPNVAVQVSDYNTFYDARDNAGSATPNVIVSSNLIYNQAPGSEYNQPTSTADNASEKFIAGATSDNFTDPGCGMTGGSYLEQNSLSNASPGTGFYYVLDYRIVPGLPVQFPAANLANVPTNDGAQSVIDASTNAGALFAQFAQPGVYTMYVKYILQQDQ